MKSPSIDQKSLRASASSFRFLVNRASFFAGLEDVLDESCGGDVEDELVQEFVFNTVRGEHSCRDSRPLGSHTYYQASYISWYNMSRAMWQLSATFANSQSCKKREILSPVPCNPMTCNTSLHTSPSQEPLEDTLSSSSQASPSLSHIGLFWQPICHSSPSSGT